MKHILIIAILVIISSLSNVEEVSDWPVDIIRGIGELPKYPLHIKPGTEGRVDLEAVLIADGKLSLIKAVASEPAGILSARQ